MTRSRDITGDVTPVELPGPNGRRRRISIFPEPSPYGWIKLAAFLIVVSGTIWAASAQFADKADRGQVEAVDAKIEQVEGQVQEIRIDVKVMQSEQRMLIRAIRPDLGSRLGGE